MDLFFLRRETTSKENTKYKNNKFMNMKITTNFEAVKLG
jgi:hypothetical protein